ncbi:hypothetical protein [Acidovorax sp. 1608163]|uniref:hypothetical protein n=1 Tax=Acidovorax sp. 1608163 TaxID=2478662 RepID=UPI001F093128|nr:hypothetical protein [Acidovorax sp. 1608163]
MKISAGFRSSIAACALMLTGCLVPEKFAASVDVQSDGGYTFRYSGTAVHALAAAEIKKAGRLTEKDQAGLKAEAEKLSGHPGFRKATYKGDGRYELEIDSPKKARPAAGHAQHFFGVHRQRRGDDHRLEGNQGQRKA